MPAFALLALVLAAPQDSNLLGAWEFRPDPEHPNRILSPRGPVLPLQLPFEWLGEGEATAVLRLPGTPPWIVLEQAAAEDLPRRKVAAAAWIAPFESLPWNGIVGAVEDTGSHERGWLLGLRERNALCGVATEETGRMTWLRGTRTLVPGVWYHLAFDYDGRRLRLFVNGELETQSEAPGGKLLYDESHPLTVGAYLDSNEEYRFTGALKEVRVWTRALRRDEARSLYRRGLDTLPEVPAPSLEVPRTPEHLAAVRRAVDRGVEALLLRQNRDGSWSGHASNYRNGMTALAAYALLKAGVSEDHPAILNALRFLSRQLPQRTYSAGCQLLLLAALGGEERRAEAEAIVERLLDWEKRSPPGTWGYPGGTPDLSNTQYAALGLWAAHALGIEVDPEVWRRMVQSTCNDYQPEAVTREFGPSGALGGTGSSRRSLGGFSYRAGGAGSPVSGSMTAAGLCILGAAGRSAGAALGGRATRLSEQARDRAFNWLEYHWSVRRNLGRPSTLYYYLYGVERVAALHGLERIGPWDWYGEGSAFLVQDQKEDGTWAGDEAKTAFAILFLVRATAPVSGLPEPALAEAWTSGAGAPLRLRVTGRHDLTLWIQEFDPSALGDAVVDRVVYRLDGEEAVAVPTDPGVPAGQQRWPARLRLTEEGEHLLVAEAVLADGRVLASEPLGLTVPPDTAAFQAQWLAEPPGENLLLRVPVQASSSSRQGRATAAGRAFDQRQGTAWICEAKDADPWLQADLRRPLRGGTLVLWPADASLFRRGHRDRVLRVGLSLNGGEERSFPCPGDPLAPVRIPLDSRAPIRSLRIRILEREPGRVHPGRCGWSEVEILAGEGGSVIGR